MADTRRVPPSLEAALAALDPDDRPRPSRRAFLQGTAALTGAALAGGFTAGRALAAEDHGVASGNPTATTVVLWTRVPDGLQSGPANLPVYWEVATSETFGVGTVLKTGQTSTSAAADYTVRVRVTGLSPFTPYYYRFYTESGYDSVVGRTLTAPDDRAMPDEIRFAFVSCSNRNGKQFNVYDTMSRDDLHFVCHLGDNVYEGSLGYTAKTLADFRALHKLYLTTPELKECRRLFPWIHTWDDHEVFNNYHGGEMTEAERAVQAAAYQAFAEFMPLDPDTAPVTTDGVTELKIYRNLRFGQLLEVFATDGRQYRDGMVCGREILVNACDDLYDPERTMLGREQTDWLKGALSASEARWKFVLNGTVMMAMKVTNRLRPLFERMVGETLGETNEGLVINLDAWDGYPENRAEILAHVEDTGIDNLVVLTGDIHNCFAGQLKSDFTKQGRGPVAGVELVTGSVTSSGAAETLYGYDITDFMFKALQPANPHIDYVDAYYHVYVRVAVRPTEAVATYVAVDTITSATYEAFELARITLPEGENRLIVEEP